MPTRSIVGGLALALVLLAAATAWATIENFKSFKQAYPGREPKAYSCKACHNSALGKKGDLNSYGEALKKSKAPADAKKLTEDDYRAIEQQDADGDGASNADEINAGTAPGDPESVPPGTTPKPAEAPAATSDAAAK